MKIKETINRCSRELFPAVAAITAMVLLMPGVPIAGAEKNRSDTEWMAVFLNKKKIGHMKYVRSTADGRVKTIIASKMVLSRMGNSVELDDHTETVETAEGRPLSFFAKKTSSGIMMIIKGTVGPDGKIKVIMEASGKKDERVIDWPEGALMPEGMRLLALKKGLKEGTAYTLSQFAVGSMSKLVIDVKVGKTANVDLLGRVMTLTEMVYTIKQGTGSIKVRSFVTEEQDMQKMIMPLMGMDMEIISCSREYALSKNSPDDFFTAVFVSSPRALSSKELAKGISYRIRTTAGDSFAHIPSTDEQKITKLNTTGEYTIGIAKQQPPGDAPLAYAGSDKTVLASLMPSRYIQSDAREVIALSRKAVGRHRDAASAARAIEAFVRTYINKKTLSVGYASALEVLKSREGDCTEHALLTAALCRAAGIPARVVAGIAYIGSYSGRDRVFVPHAWTQVFIRGKWYSLDAALGTFSAGHIALNYGSGDPMDFFTLIKILGNIEILKVE